MMKVMEYMKIFGHEQLVYCSDPQVGLFAIIAIHDTTLGPALGGTRMWPYKSEEEAVLDVLRLSRAMTYKASIAGLNLGGGKAVIIGDPLSDKTVGKFRSLGRFIESLGGRYITTEDVGTTVADMQQIYAETKHVTGLPLGWGASGDPSPPTAFGVYQGMKACCEEVYASSSLKGKTVAIQGFGKVGSCLAVHLCEEGANMIVTDINERSIKKAADQYSARIVQPDEIYDVPCDIFSPCALGATLNRRTIPRLQCKIVAGSANNQLEEDDDGDLLSQRRILYAPDYAINGGGIINLSLELTGYNEQTAKAQVSEIHGTIERIISLAKSKQMSTSRAADTIAQQRIDDARKVRPMFSGKH